MESFNAFYWHYLTKSTFYPGFFMARGQWATALWNFGRLQFHCKDASAPHIRQAVTEALAELPEDSARLLRRRSYIAMWQRACGVVAAAEMDCVARVLESHNATERQIMCDLDGEFAAAAAAE